MQDSNVTTPGTHGSTVVTTPETFSWERRRLPPDPNSPYIMPMIAALPYRGYSAPSGIGYHMQTTQGVSAEIVLFIFRQPRFKSENDVRSFVFNAEQDGLTIKGKYALCC